MALALQILASGFAAGAVYGLVAVGHSVVFRLTGVVHFAFGELIALGVFVTLLVAAGSGPVSQTSVGGARFLLALGRRADVRRRPAHGRGGRPAVRGLRAALRGRVRRRPGRRPHRLGRGVIEPPETPMHAYDFVSLLAAAITRAASSDPEKVTKALEQVTVEGANGDERGFNQASHEGVVDDDVYFGRFHDMTYAPVQDDPFSRTLPIVSQTR